MANDTYCEHPLRAQQSAFYLGWVPGIRGYLKRLKLTEMSTDDMRDWLEERLLMAEKGELACNDPFYEILDAYRVRILPTATGPPLLDMSLPEWQATQF